MDRPTAEALLATAEDARARIRREEPGAAELIEQRYPAMLEALDWLRADGQSDQAFRLATALVPFWISTKRIEDGDRWFARALAQPGGTDGRRARAVYDHGYLVFWSGQYEAAAERFGEARARATELADGNLAALALAGSARVALNDDVAEAVRLLREALVVGEGSDDQEGRSSALHVLGVALQMSGDLEGARDVMSARLDLGRARGEEFTVWVESANLSMVERQLGNLDRAEALSTEALTIVARRGDAMAIPWIVNGLAAVTAAKGDLARAATLNGMCAAMLERAAGQWPADERQQYEATLDMIRSGLGEDAIDRARADGAAMSLEEGVAYALARGDREGSSALA